MSDSCRHFVTLDMTEHVSMDLRPWLMPAVALRLQSLQLKLTRRVVIR